MRRITVGLLLFAATGSIPGGAALAEVLPAAPIHIMGTVDRLTHGPGGRADGVVLEDHTFLQFRPAALANETDLRAGDPILATGFQTLSKPNRVLDRVKIEKYGKTVLDDSKQAQAQGFSAARDLPQMKSVQVSSLLLAVGTRPNGDVNRLILENGTSVGIPPGAFVDSSRLQLGQRLSASGVGTQNSGGGFLVAMSLESATRTSLISARTGFGEQWRTNAGRIKQVLLDPRGWAEGLLLSDNSAIRFYPVPPNRVSELTPGVMVKAAGPALFNQLRTNFILMTEQDRVVELAHRREQAGIAAPLARQSGTLTPLKDRSRVRALLRGPGEDVQMIVLEDGATVEIPQHLRRKLPRALKAGDSVEVDGIGGKYPRGIGIEASQIQLTSRA